MTKPRTDLRLKTLQPCFYIGREMYVPHVSKPNTWVTFGGLETKTLRELKEIGANMNYEYLFIQVPPNDWITKVKTRVKV